MAERQRTVANSQRAPLPRAQQLQIIASIRIPNYAIGNTRQSSADHAATTRNRHRCWRWPLLLPLGRTLMQHEIARHTYAHWLNYNLLAGASSNIVLPVRSDLSVCVCANDWSYLGDAKHLCQISWKSESWFWSERNERHIDFSSFRNFKRSLDTTDVTVTVLLHSLFDCLT